MSAVQRYLMLPNHVPTAVLHNLNRKKQSVNLRKKATKAEPTTEEEVKDWKYYLKRIGGFIGILIAGKILSKIILTLF